MPGELISGLPQAAKEGGAPISPKLLPLLQEARAMATCPFVIERGSKRVASVKTGVSAAARRAYCWRHAPYGRDLDGDAGSGDRAYRPHAGAQ
jgi:hypothetical protein